MKVLQVIPSMNIGGREKVVLSILENIDRRRFEVEVACLGGSGTLFNDFLEADVPTRFFYKNPGFKPKLYFELRRFLCREKYHIVHSHNPGAFLYAAVPAKLAGVPVIINTEHGYGERISRGKEIAESILRNRINLTLSVSHELQKKLSQAHFLKYGKVKTLYNGIEIEAYNDRSQREKIREFLGFRSSTIVIGSVGRLAPVKDHETLLRSYHIVQKIFPTARLLIVGDGEQRDFLINLSKNLGLLDKVTFAGERDDVPKLLSAMDVFALSSLSEGISITLLEAMAAGLPIVATSVGGNIEVVEDGVTGLLIPPKNPNRMAEAINEILSDKIIAQSFSRDGKRKVIEKFSSKKMVRTLEEIYESSMRGR